MVKYLSIDNLQALDIGHVSDNQTSEVSIDCGAWRRKYPALTEYNLFVTNPQGMIYPANTVMTEDGKLLWKICDTDTSIPGVGRYQIIATGRYGDRKASKFADLTIAANMPGMDGAAPPDPSKAWVGDVIAARREAENAARAATDSAEAVAHPPIIGENGNWWLWDNEQKTYVDSGFDSRPDAAPYTLPTASETVKGGVKVGTGLRMDGDVLNAEVTKEDVDKLFEEKADKLNAPVHIDTITIEEETQRIEIDKEPDGTPYAFKKIVVRITAEPTDVLGNWSLFPVYNDGSGEIGVIIPSFPDRQKTIYGMYVCDVYDGFANFYAYKGNYGAIYNAFQTTYIAAIDDLIRKFSLRVPTGIAMGTKIEIWAVRA